MLFCQPEFTPVFPWLRVAFRPSFNSAGLSFPGFVEPVAGALNLAPFLVAGLAASVAFGMVANLALGIAGPYDAILRDRPATYLRIAGWFSPIERFWPVLDPRLNLELNVRFRTQPDRFREPLATSGGAMYRHFFCSEHHGGKLRLVSKSDTSTAACEMEHPGERPVRIRLTHDPASHRMSATVDGNEVLAHEVPVLVLTPSQITIGLSHADLPGTPPCFRAETDSKRPAV